MSFTNVFTPSLLHGPIPYWMKFRNGGGVPSMGKIKRELKVRLGLGARNGVRSGVE